MPHTDRTDPETTLRWRKARRSGGGGGSGGGNDCVEVAWLDGRGARAVRDSKLGDASPILRLSAANWAVLRAAALDGTLHAPAS